MSVKNQDPPETATAELEELLTGVVDDCNPEELDVEVDAVLAVVLILVPGIVYALIAPNAPTPTTALTAAPIVSRFSRLIAASRARTLSWTVPLISTDLVLRPALSAT